MPDITGNPVTDIPAYEAALQACNDDKMALRAWRDGLRKAAQ